ncbi:MAG: prepilin-type N-terminal cleavage/methylation domain-containing protein [Candidatus Blackburnbacteria bacterium]|nr:prepilin-type N-terminal cleavage/methylation domain-containing protein [Candidatus Blackburnbacteria bacterium]
MKFSIFNFQFPIKIKLKNRKSQPTGNWRLETGESAFTLIELLVVMTIFTIVLLVVSQVLFSTFKGASKSEAQDTVKRQGEQAMAVMERAIRNARTIYTCSGGLTVTYQEPSLSTGSFSCTNIGSGSGYIASVRGPLTASDVDVTSCSITCEMINGVNKVVIINASFAAKGTALNLRTEEKGAISLQSRILLRN